MKNQFLFVFLVSFLLLQACSSEENGELVFKKLMVEYAENPIDIDIANPRFSWIIEAEGRGKKQSAYQIMLASSKDLLERNKPDIWDSGKQRSATTLHHAYPNSELSSNKRYFWKLITWDENNKNFESSITYFETAILDPAIWKAHWIGNGPEKEALPAKGFYGTAKREQPQKDTVNHMGNSVLLRKEVNLKNKIKRAKIFVSGLGFYELYINGNRVGDRVLAPAKTPYHKHILYDSYDVSDQLINGDNAIGIHLGNGWYNPYRKWWKQYRMQWFGSKKVMAQLHVCYEDGTAQIITSDKEWKWHDGPITFNCIYDGESYNANLEQKGWKKVGFDDSHWKKVNKIESPNARLLSHRMPAIKVNQSINPEEIAVDEKGMYVFDMGQNFSGWVGIKVKGEKDTRIRIRFAEDINEDGTIDRSSAEKAIATAEYILKGEGEEYYEPAFSYFGFQYVELVFDQPIELLDIQGKVVYSDNAQSGTFECSNTLVNKIHNATLWSQKSNMLGYPMDCPQRDERLGWFGDAQVTAEEAMFNFDMALFYENWFEGIRENQDEKTGDIPIISPQPYFEDEGIEWSSTYVIMLWQFYQYYGDKRILKRHFPAMKRYMEYLHNISDKYILPKGWIGDWGSLSKGWKGGNPVSTPTAFYYFNATILSKIATVIDEKEDAEFYTSLAGNIKNAYNKEYLNPESGNYLQGTQMDNAFPLFLGLVPDDLRPKVLKNLITDIVDKNDTHLTTGVLGTKYMPEALAEEGKFDVVWNIINQKTYPSWNAMMEKYTTVCEFWTLKQSKNHVMMGSIDAWFYKYITGIQLDENNPAYGEFTIKPNLLEGLDYATANLETIKGNVVSSWKKEQNTLTMEVKVPFNTQANVFVPGNKSGLLLENGKPIDNAEGVEYLGFEKGAHKLSVSSGNYTFSHKLN